MNRATRYEFHKLIRQRTEGLHPPGQELCVVVHPDNKSEGEEWAKEIESALGTGETIGVVTDKNCQKGKKHLVNRDFYDEVGDGPWKVMH